MTLLASAVLFAAMLARGATDAEMAAATAQGVKTTTNTAAMHLDYAKKLVTAVASGARSLSRSPPFTRHTEAPGTPCADSVDLFI